MNNRPDYDSRDEPSFVIVNLERLATAKEISPLQQKVLYFLMSNMNYDNTASITKSEKDRFLRANNTTTNSFSNTISKLAKNNFLKVESRGKYIINQTYFTKGIEGEQ